MGIEIIDGFRIISSASGVALGVESDKLEQCMEYAIHKGIKRIFLHGLDGYKLRDVNFLEKYNFFTEISITDELIDMSGVHYLANLKYLSLSNGRQPVDLRKFKYLEECSIDWNNKILGLDKLNPIRKLSIWKFKPQSKNFTDLSGCHKLEYLHVTQANITSFEGINMLKSLNHFEGHYLSKLESLDGLETVSSHLRTLVLDYCRKLNNYEDVLGKLTKLEKLILGDCGDLASIKFAKGLKNMKFFSFVNTNVLDGDLEPVLGLEYIGFDDKRHYSHKWGEVKAKK